MRYEKVLEEIEPKHKKWNPSTLQYEYVGSPAESFIPPDYDKVSLTYSGGNITGVDYSFEGVMVQTLVMKYSGDNIISIEKT